MKHILRPHFRSCIKSAILLQSIQKWKCGSIQRRIHIIISLLLGNPPPPLSLPAGISDSIYLYKFNSITLLKKICYFSTFPWWWKSTTHSLRTDWWNEETICWILEHWCCPIQSPCWSSICTADFKRRTCYRLKGKFSAACKALLSGATPLKKQPTVITPCLVLIKIANRLMIRHS